MNKIKQVIIIRKDLKMRRGKEAAQVAHASMQVFLNKMSVIEYNKEPINYIGTYFCNFTDEMISWIDNSFTKVVVSCNSEEELFDLKKQAEDLNIINAIIQDNGETEFKENCPQCLGEGKVNTNLHKLKCPTCNGTGKIKLKPREEKIIQLREKGLTIKEIAKFLKIGTTTVFYYLDINKQRKYQRNYKRKIRGYSGNRKKYKYK